MCAYASNKRRKSKATNQSKRVEFYEKINYSLIENDSWLISKVIAVYNHGMDSSLLRFTPYNRKLTRTIKRKS